ncbi:MAG: hypothetical protein ABI268_05445 [Rhodanobacter sp.]
MTDLTEFASLSIAELTVELESMLDKAHEKTRQRAERFAANRFTPTTASPSRDALKVSPLNRAAGGTTLELIV